MARILALDSSTEACSVALLAENEAFHRFSETPRAHTQLLLPMVDQVLAEAKISLSELDAIAFGRGPGSFTGIRIAASMAQGLAFATEKPLLAISTLAALAQGAFEKAREEHVQLPDSIVAAIDARMAEIYWACFCLGPEGLVNLVGEEQMSSPAKFVINKQNKESLICGVGTGWRYKDQMPSSFQSVNCYPDALPDAVHIARLADRDFANGLAQSAENALPVYLRDNVAWQNG
jgi:tRNA threonylcarbamoyladenosine biosynthesis protein TsaB